MPDKAHRCRICTARGDTEWHHIISRNRCAALKRWDLLTSLGNLVELCSTCHDHTTASLVKGRLQEERSAIQSNNQGPESAKKSSHSHRRRLIRGDLRCFRCGRRGHLVPGCSEAEDLEGRRLTPDGSANQWLVHHRGTACFRCGRSGHLWRRCTATHHMDGRRLLPVNG